jgi:hypothetical protein
MNNPIVLRRTDSIGAADAENDGEFLNRCFVDSGQIEVLRNCRDPKCIILGRTGAGKTALLLAIKTNVENAVELAPEALSLNFLINSNVLNFFESAGVHLDAFYKLLWHHVFCVELIKAKYQIRNEQKQKDFFTNLIDLFQRDKAKEAAVRYLEQWGQKFWEETSARVREFTARLETELSANASVGNELIKMGAKGAQKLSEEQKAEVVQHGQQVVSKVHIQDLHNVIRLLREDIFDDQLQPFYLLIDRLDENWVEDSIRYKLIRALIDAVRSFRQVQNVKVLVSLRTDLLYSVLHRNPQSGFQTEKYETLYSSIPWNRELLQRLLDMRTESLFKRKYTGHTVRVHDIMPPAKIGQKSPLDYLLERTFFRPREAILFMNECIQRADGKPRITMEVLKAAEATHSGKRLASLCEEWAHNYPSLQVLTGLVSRRNAVFPITNITDDDASRLMAGLLEKFPDAADPAVEAARAYMNSGGSYQEFVYSAVAVLYQVGLVGLKLAPHLAVQWSYLDEPVIQTRQLSETTDIHVHKTFWIALNVTTKHRRRE